MIRCVAFDLDGVVIPSGPSFDFFENTYSISREQFGQFFTGPYRAAMQGKADLHDVLPATLDAWGWPGTLQEFCRVWLESCSDCDPAVVASIESLHRVGIATCIATNQDNRRAAHLDSLPILQRLFAQRFFSCRMGVTKPEAGYFRRVQHELLLTPEEILFLDDRSDNVQAARACGWSAERCRDSVDVDSALRAHVDGLR